MLYQRILAEYQRLEKQIGELRAQLASCPEGKLICTNNKTRWKWYLSDGKKSTYLPKENRPLAEKLAAKRYLALLLEDLIQEQKALSYYLRHYSKSTGKAEKMLTETSEYQKLLSPYFKPSCEELSQWMEEPYERNTRNQEHLIHKTASGYFVRSKSEALIDFMLYTYKLPFRYECVLQLSDTFIYPDFTIRHPKTGKTYYWEHFGKMDDLRYSKNACSKLQLYVSHGIIPSIHLITTYETMENPLSSETVAGIINHYFL